MSNDNAAQIEEIELSIADAKVQIERKEMLTRLEKNPDFKKLIAEGFMEKHAVRQVLLKAHPDMQTEKAQKLLDDQITAVGQFKQFMISIWTLGSNAEEALRQDEATLTEILAEDQEAGES